MGDGHGELAEPHRTWRQSELDDYLVRDCHRNIGAEIMGRNKFGPQRGRWQDEDWKGWWGEAAVPHHLRRRPLTPLGMALA